MAKQKYWDGTKWVQVAPSMQEFNEHQADGTAHGIGNKTTLKTSHKSTLVGALNELFTNVSNGKSLVGGAITGVDNSIVIPTDPTFQQLADAIGGISTGKKWASGSTQASSGVLTVTGLGFTPSTVIAVFTQAFMVIMTTAIVEFSRGDPINYTTESGRGTIGTSSFTTNGFSLNVIASSLSYNWIAYE